MTDQTNPDVIVTQNVHSADGSAWDAVIDQIPHIIEESKAGWKSTEFWVTIVIGLLTVLDAIPLPEKYEAIVVGALGVAYAISRGLAKKGVPNIVPLPDDTPAS